MESEVHFRASGGLAIIQPKNPNRYSEITATCDL